MNNPAPYNDGSNLPTGPSGGYQSAAPGFKPPYTDADEHGMTIQSNYFEDLIRRISGRGDSVAAAIDSAVVEFSDIIADPIERNKSYMRPAWEKAAKAAWFGSVVAAGWGRDVTNFKKTIDGYVVQWNEARRRLESASDPAAEAEASQRKHQLHTTLMGLARIAKGTLEGNASTRNSQLKAGPTPAVLKQLVESGDTRWGGYNMVGREAPTPLKAKDGEKFAEALKGKNGEKLTAKELEQLKALRALTDHALWAQKNDHALTDAELKYLETLYGDKHGLGKDLTKMDGYADKSGAGDILRAALGGGLLALSSPKLGGSYDKLPEWLKDRLDRSTRHSGTKVGKDWTEIADIAPLLKATDNPIVKDQNGNLIGGGEFSKKMTVFVADNVTPLKGDDIKRAEDLLDVSTRNNYANSDLLAGDVGGSRGEKYGRYATESVLRDLFGNRDWRDDGESASRLIGWIGDWANDPDHRNLAGRAAAEVIKAMTANGNKGEHAKLFDESAFAFFVDGLGAMKDNPDTEGVFETDPKASLGLANPMIARALADSIVKPYIYAFGGGYGGSDGNPSVGPDFDKYGPDRTGWFYDEKAKQWYLSVNMNAPDINADGKPDGDGVPEGRDNATEFFQLLMSDPETKSAVTDAVANQVRKNALMYAEEGDNRNTEYGQNSGTLLSVLQNAQRNDDLDRVSALEDNDQKKAVKEFIDMKKSFDKQDKTTDFFKRVGFNLVDQIPGVDKPPFKFFKDIGKSGVETGIDAYKYNRDWNSGNPATVQNDTSDVRLSPQANDKELWHLKLSSTHQIIQYGVKSGNIDINDLKEASPDLVDKDDKLKPFEEITTGSKARGIYKAAMREWTGEYAPRFGQYSDDLTTGYEKPKWTDADFDKYRQQFNDQNNIHGNEPKKK